MPSRNYILEDGPSSKQASAATWHDTGLLPRIASPTPLNFLLKSIDFGCLLTAEAGRDLPWLKKSALVRRVANKMSVDAEYAAVLVAEYAKFLELKAACDARSLFNKQIIRIIRTTNQ